MVRPRHVVVLVVTLLASVACGGKNPASPTGAYPNVTGAWAGTLTAVGGGASISCNYSMIVNTQNAGTFSGTYQESGGLGCASAGAVSGTVGLDGSIGLGSTGTSVSTGASCSDNPGVINGLLEGNRITIQLSFIRTCIGTGSFSVSQTLTLTRS